jgi:DHA2 family multidrug resistance protein
VSLFIGSSFLSGIAPNLTILILARVLQGLGGGPLIPLSQAIMWEIFPLKQRGMAMAVWGVGVMFGPIVGPTLGGWVADNWSWRWIFYMNIPIGLAGLFMLSAFLFDPPYLKKPERIDGWGLAFMVLGFGALQLVLDRGEREDWFASDWIVALSVLACSALLAFLVRQLSTDHPVMDLGVMRDPNFAIATVIVTMLATGLYASMILLALYAQTLLGYDAWNSGLLLAPAGVGNLFSLLLVGWLVTRVDPRFLLVFGAAVNAVALYAMSQAHLGVDFWNLVWPRFLHGFALPFVFIPLTTLAFATVPRAKLGNATSVYNVIRNLGGSVGVAVTATFLARRSQVHQATLVNHVNVWDPETTLHLRQWTEHFVRQGTDAFTAHDRALAMLYRSTVEQARVLAFMDDFRLLALLFALMLVLIPFLRRVSMESPSDAPARGAALE